MTVAQNYLLVGNALIQTTLHNYSSIRYNEIQYAKCVDTDKHQTTTTQWNCNKFRLQLKLGPRNVLGISTSATQGTKRFKLTHIT